MIVVDGHCLTRRLVIGLLGLAACGAQVSQAKPRQAFGYIVVGRTAASAYGLVPGDTLGEVPRQEVPNIVVSASEAEATRIDYAPHCSRYFLGSAKYLVLLKVRCKMDETVEDGEALLAFLASGQPAGRPLLSLTADAYTDLWPGTRYEH